MHGCKGYEAILGVAAVIFESSVDFPALGSPTIPTSAIILSSRVKRLSSPGSPGSAMRGVLRVEVAKC